MWIIENIIINKTSKESIYEQIIFQIKLAIAKKELQIGDALPSVRVMAKMLSVSTLSVQRAYKELQAMRIIESSGGKGNFISSTVNETLIKEALFQGVEEEMKQLISIAKQNGIEMGDLQELVHILWEEEIEEEINDGKSIKNNSKKEVFIMERNKFMETYEKVPAHVVFEIDGEMKKMKRWIIPINLIHLTEPSFSCVFSSTAIRLAKGRKEVLVLPFVQIKNVEVVISRVKAMVSAAKVSSSVNCYIANLKIKLNDGQQVYFDSLILSDIPKVIAKFEKNNISVADVYNIVDILTAMEDAKEINKYFEENLDNLAEMNGLNPEKQTWKNLG